MVKQGRRKQTKQPALKPLSENNPIAIALDYIYTLLERISLGRIKVCDPAQLSQLRRLTGPQLKDVIAHLHTSIQDMKGALAGDDFLIESYSNFTKTQLKLAVEYLSLLVKLKPDVDATGKIRRRKERVKVKEITPEKIIENVLFLKDDKVTGLSSVDPSEIVGASMVWVYNAETRKLGCYYATNGHGLTVKGTTILNYDEKQSKTKTIRKPKKQVKEFMLGSPKWQLSYWTAIRAKPQKISPRLNRDTLILKVIQPI